MTASSRYTRAISSEVGDIERRLRILQNGIEKLGTRASSNARDTTDGLGEAVASALSSWADRFRQGTNSLSEQSGAFGKDAARYGKLRLREVHYRCVKHQKEKIMAGDTRTSKTNGRRRGVAALGVAGALSLVSGVCGACGASAATPPAGNMQNSARALLAEEEISDVSLATFHVFDHENVGTHHSGVQLAYRGCGGCRGCRGCGRGCDGGCGGCGGCGGYCLSWGGCGIC